MAKSFIESWETFIKDGSGAVDDDAITRSEGLEC